MSIDATTTTATPTTTAATAPVPVETNFSQTLPSLVASAAQPIAGPSFPCGTFYSAHPATHPATHTPPLAQPGVPACPATGKGKGKRGTQAPKGGGRRTERVCSTAAAAADASFLCYNDPDPSNPLPTFAAPKFAPTRPVGLHLEGPHIRNTMVKPIEFFCLFFSQEMVDKIVLHMNTYAYIHITQYASKKYTNLGGSWKETFSDEIFRLIALLIYFSLVKVTGEVDKYWSTSTLYHGLWA